jgi:hypothetical protein
MRPGPRGVPRLPLFYGWWMVWLGGFLSSLNKTAVNRGFPVFVAPVRESFGASNAAVAFIFSLARAQSGRRVSSRAGSSTALVRAARCWSGRC